MTDGKDYKTNKAAKRISKNMDEIYKLAKKQYEADQTSASNLSGLIINLRKIAMFPVKFAKNDVVEALALTEYAVKGILWGLKRGIKQRDLMALLTSVLRGATSGAVGGAYAGFGNIAADAAKN